MDGLNILTDPIWSNRQGPIIGVARHRPPGIRFEDLPPIDVVLVSHDHHDHMDLPTLRRLAERNAPRIYVGLGNAAFLAKNGVAGGGGLDWGPSAEVTSSVSATATPAPP